jgi:hypothetical protein
MTSDAHYNKNVKPLAIENPRPRYSVRYGSGWNQAGLHRKAMGDVPLCAPPLSLHCNPTRSIIHVRRPCHVKNRGNRRNGIVSR